jgi:hypothetical protein
MRQNDEGTKHTIKEKSQITIEIKLTAGLDTEQVSKPIEQVNRSSR